jgi:branched-subunit amino acid aminotransferase/4-amino-4-deoxychorismate lyase
MNHFAIVNDSMLPESQASLQVTDLAIQRGVGIFDFFKVYKGKPLFLEAHLDRFFNSVAIMRLEPEFTRIELKNKLIELIRVNGMEQSGVRVTLTGGYSTDGYSLAKANLVITEQPTKLPVSLEENGIKLITHSFQRQLPQVKTIDYLMAVWLQWQVKDAGANDVLYHSNGTVSECPRANIFIVTPDNKLVTPSNNILKGITRSEVIKLAMSDIKVEERDLRVDEIFSAKEVFITSTTKHVLPVSHIDGRQIGKGVAGEISRWLALEYNKLVFG